jgi:multidrug efflux pump subunit AcrA (membrane-fusion protein)
MDISQITENMDVDITLDAYPDSELTGKIKDISVVAKVTSSGVFYEAVVDVINKAKLENISGLTAEIDIILEGKKDILIIPNVAIKEVAGKKIVEKRNIDKSITQIEIKTGITDYTYTEVISGLNEGDEVVISK